MTCSVGEERSRMQTETAASSSSFPPASSSSFTVCTETETRVADFNGPPPWEGFGHGQVPTKQTTPVLDPKLPHRFEPAAIKADPPWEGLTLDCSSKDKLEPAPEAAVESKDAAPSLHSANGTAEGGFSSGMKVNTSRHILCGMHRGI